MCVVTPEPSLGLQRSFSRFIIAEINLDCVFLWALWGAHVYVCESGWASWGLQKALCAVRSPAFAGALGLCRCAYTHKMSSVSKITSHISNNSEADSSFLAVRDTLESRCGSLLWRITENLVKPVSPSAGTAAWQQAWARPCLCSSARWGEIMQNSLSQNSVYHHRRSRAPVCVPAQSCHQQLLNSTTFWISTHHENPPLIKCSRGNKKFKMHFQAGLVHTIRSILGTKSFLLVSAVEGGSGDTRSKQNQQAAHEVTWQHEGSKKEEAEVQDWVRHCGGWIRKHFASQLELFN